MASDERFNRAIEVVGRTLGAGVWTEAAVNVRDTLRLARLAAECECDAPPFESVVEICKLMIQEAARIRGERAVVDDE
jgi:hypothetical protein